jgi:hypothetical protein
VRPTRPPYRVRDNDGSADLRSVRFVLLLLLAVAIAGLGLPLLGAWLLTEYSIATNTYPFMGCEPPSLTEEQAKDAVRMMAREVLGDMNPQIEGPNLRRTEERWPRFLGWVTVLKEGGETIYAVEGNGCGLEIRDPGYEIVVVVSLPENKLFSVRRGSAYQRF